MGKRGSGQGYVPGGHGVKAVQKRDTLQAKLYAPQQRSQSKEEWIFRNMTPAQKDFTEKMAMAMYARQKVLGLGGGRWRYESGEEKWMEKHEMSSIRVLQLAKVYADKYWDKSFSEKDIKIPIPPNELKKYADLHKKEVKKALEQKKAEEEKARVKGYDEWKAKGLSDKEIAKAHAKVIYERTLNHRNNVYLVDGVAVIGLKSTKPDVKSPTEFCKKHTDPEREWGGYFTMEGTLFGFVRGGKRTTPGFLQGDRSDYSPDFPQINLHTHPTNDGRIAGGWFSAGDFEALGMKNFKVFAMSEAGRNAVHIITKTKNANYMGWRNEITSYRLNNAEKALIRKDAGGDRYLESWLKFAYRQNKYTERALELAPKYKVNYKVIPINKLKDSDFGIVSKVTDSKGRVSGNVKSTVKPKKKTTKKKSTSVKTKTKTKKKTTKAKKKKSTSVKKKWSVPKDKASAKKELARLNAIRPKTPDIIDKIMAIEEKYDLY